MQSVSLQLIRTREAFYGCRLSEAFLPNRWPEQKGTYPFWSDDSKSIGFLANGKLKTIDANGGPSLTLCDRADNRGGTWAGDEFGFRRITSAIYRGSAKGGVGNRLPGSILPSTAPSLAFFLAGWKAFPVFSCKSSAQQRTGWNLFRFPGRKRESSRSSYKLQCGLCIEFLLYLRDNDLMAQRFAPNKGELTGEPGLIIQNVHFDKRHGVGSSLPLKTTG